MFLIISLKLTAYDRKLVDCVTKATYIYAIGREGRVSLLIKLSPCRREMRKENDLTVEIYLKKLGFELTYPYLRFYSTRTFKK